MSWEWGQGEVPRRGDIGAEAQMTRSQLFRDLGKQVPGRGNSNCKCPEARMNLTCLRKGKKTNVIGWWAGHEVMSGGPDRWSRASSAVVSSHFSSL